MEATPRRVILVPWRGGEEHRERSWALVRPYYEQLGWPMFVGDSGNDPFSTAQSYNVASEMAGDWDTAFIINTDCVIPLENAVRGMEHAEATERLTLPHDDFHELAAGHFPEPPPGHGWRYHRRRDKAYVGRRRAPAGAIAMPRTVWDRVGGYDNRFIHWGWEDTALLRAVGEFDRLPGIMYHYWHPRRPVVVGTSKAIFDAEYKDLPVDWRLVTE